jgi:uncharacterized protein YlbG (UPF0298 family)
VNIYIYILKLCLSVYKLRFLKAIIISKGRNRIINPSRIDPKFLSFYNKTFKKDEMPRSTLSTLHHPNLPALCYSVIYVDESHVQSPYSANQDSKYVKSITGKLFSGELERMISTILMALKLDHAKAQLSKDWLSFTCRPVKQGMVTLSSPSL